MGDQAARSHGTCQAGICPGDRLSTASSAPGTHSHASSSSGVTRPSEHTYGGPTGRRCCTFLLYSLFESFEFGF